MESSEPLKTDNCFTSAGGEVANAQVCKTCIRGFNPRPALQIFTDQQKGPLLAAAPLSQFAILTSDA
jgi:hypothetical protein